MSVNVTVAYLPWFVAIVGLVIYFGTSSSKVSESGRLAFLAGLIAALMTHAHC